MFCKPLTVLVAVLAVVLLAASTANASIGRLSQCYKAN